MRNLSLLLAALVALTALPRATDAAIQWEATFTLSGGLIHGHTPIPQINGFDYVFSNLGNDTAVSGVGITVESVEIESFATNLSNIINFDWEVFIGGVAFGLPAGQFLQTHVDPVSGYSRTAPVHVGFNINTLRFPDRNNYLLFTEYDFETNTDSGTFLHHNWDVQHSTFDAPDGLYAQVFAWTGDNRNVGIIFDEFTVTIRGTAESLVSEVPEPANATAVLLLLAAVAAFYLHRQHVQMQKAA